MYAPFHGTIWVMCLNSSSCCLPVQNVIHNKLWNLPSGRKHILGGLNDNDLCYLAEKIHAVESKPITYQKFAKVFQIISRLNFSNKNHLLSIHFEKMLAFHFGNGSFQLCRFRYWHIDPLNYKCFNENLADQTKTFEVLGRGYTEFAQ